MNDLDWRRISCQEMKSPGLCVGGRGALDERPSWLGVTGRGVKASMETSCRTNCWHRSVGGERPAAHGPDVVTRAGRNPVSRLSALDVLYFA